MKLSIVLLIVGLCAVYAKYLPEEWDSSDQSLSRFKRFDLGDSDTSSEDDDDSDSKNDDSDNSTDETDVKEQSKRVANLERMRQKLLEKQEKERLKQEEAQRKIEERIAKELQKEEEKRQKEQRKWEEKLEKERKKLEEEQRKIQEKLAENERKRQEKIQKEMEKLDKQASDSSLSNDDDDSDDDSIELEDIWKIHIYSKYGITEENTNVEKKAALRKYMQEELGLNANSTQSERRQAVLRFIQSELQKVPNINTLRNQFIDYINYVGVQKIRTKLEGDIEKLKNKTETLNNVNFTWVPVAQENIAEQVSFLETIKQFLSNLLPNWFDGNTDKPQQGVPVTNAGSAISPDSSIVTQQTSEANRINAVNTSNDVSSSNTEDNAPNSPSAPNNNGASVSTSSSAVSESSLIDSEKDIKGSVVDVANANQVSANSENNSQTPSAAESNDAAIAANEVSVNKQLHSVTSTDTVEVTNNAINDLNPKEATTVVTKHDGMTNSNSDHKEEAAIPTDSVNNVNISPVIPTESQSNPSIDESSVIDSVNQNGGDNINQNVGATNKNVDSATEYANKGVSESELIVTIGDGIISSSIPSFGIGEASSSVSNNNNENTGTASVIPNEQKPVNVDTITLESKNSIADTVSESNPAVDNGVASSGLSGTGNTEASVTTVASDYTAPLGNTINVSSITSEGANNVNSDVTQNIPTNSITNTNEVNESPLIINGIQSQVSTETNEVVTEATNVNSSSSLINQVQSNPGSSNTEQVINEITTANIVKESTNAVDQAQSNSESSTNVQQVTNEVTSATAFNESSSVVNQEQPNPDTTQQQLINDVTTAVTEQILISETKLSEGDLKTDSVTQETTVNTPIPVESGAAVVDVAQQ